MIITLFYNSINETEAKASIVPDIEKAISGAPYKIDYIKEYWKNDGAYEAKIEVSNNNLKSVQDFFAVDWIEIGNPVEEYITSNTMKDSGIKDGYLMINIFVEVEDDIKN